MHCGTARTFEPRTRSNVVRRGSRAPHGCASPISESASFSLDSGLGAGSERLCRWHVSDDAATRTRASRRDRQLRSRSHRARAGAGAGDAAAWFALRRRAPPEHAPPGDRASSQRGATRRTQPYGAIVSGDFMGTRQKARGIRRCSSSGFYCTLEPRALTGPRFARFAASVATARPLHTVQHRDCSRSALLLPASRSVSARASARERTRRPQRPARAISSTARRSLAGAPRAFFGGIPADAGHTTRHFVESRAHHSRDSEAKRVRDDRESVREERATRRGRLERHRHGRRASRAPSVVSAPNRTNAAAALAPIARSARWCRAPRRDRRGAPRSGRAALRRRCETERERLSRTSQCACKLGYSASGESSRCLNIDGMYAHMSGQLE